MSGLWLCTARQSKNPYFLEEFDHNIYSYEELCYCMIQHLYLLDESFFKPSLCTWLLEETGWEPASRLKIMIEQKEPALKCVLFILKQGNYCSREEISEVEYMMTHLNGRSESQKKKIKGDYLMKHQKYMAAANLYSQILENSEEELSDKERGTILHNRGTAYARLFLFQEASECYLEAYHCNQEEDTYTQYLTALRFWLGEKNYIQKAEEDSILKENSFLLERRLESLHREMQESEQKKQLEKVLNEKKEGRVTEYYDGLNRILETWKSQYRRNVSLL